MTESERLLWSRVRMKQLKGRQFYRQKILGNYIVDFYCPSARLIVQVDGSQHYTQEGMTRDKDQANFMQGLNIRVLRFSSIEVVTNIDGVVFEIFEHL